jgi:hypothetical protein
MVKGEGEEDAGPWLSKDTRARSPDQIQCLTLLSSIAPADVKVNLIYIRSVLHAHYLQIPSEHHSLEPMTMQLFLIACYSLWSHYSPFSFLSHEQHGFLQEFCHRHCFIHKNGHAPSLTVK